MIGAQLEESIWQAIICCLADRIVASLRARQKTALVLLMATDLGLEQLPNCLGVLRHEGWILRSVLSAQARKTFSAAQLNAAGVDPVADDDADVDALLDGCGSVLVPALSINSAAKVACGIRDSLASALLARALERGMTVIAATDGCCPDNPERLAQGFLVSDAYKVRLRANLQALRDFGVRLVPACELASAAQQAGGPAAEIRVRAAEAVTMPSASFAASAGDRRIFSRSDAVQCQPGELRLGRDVLVTPLAVDELRIRNVRLIQT